jgi:hypothetical protein
MYSVGKDTILIQSQPFINIWITIKVNWALP